MSAMGRKRTLVADLFIQVVPFPESACFLKGQCRAQGKKGYFTLSYDRPLAYGAFESDGKLIPACHEVPESLSTIAWSICAKVAMDAFVDLSSNLPRTC